MRIPNCFIVGAPKCGTSAMYALLKEHPQIFLSRLKEPHYFGSDHHRVRHEPMTREQYLALFAEAKDQVRVGEGSTSYLHSERAAAEIKAFNPEASIIVMLRDPVEVMSAYHYENLIGGFETTPCFEEALEAESMRKRGLLMPPRAGILENLCYREVATFAPQLKRYFDIFGREKVHVIIFDDWKKEPARIYRETLQFLNVDDTFQPAFRDVNASRRLRSLRLHRFLVTPQVWLQAFSQKWIPATWRYELVAALRRLNTRRGARPPIKPELRQRLKAECAPDVQELSRLLNRDLTDWSR